MRAEQGEARRGVVEGGYDLEGFQAMTLSAVERAEGPLVYILVARRAAAGVPGEVLLDEPEGSPMGVG